jgi:Ca-activated chloride channel family protein
MMDANKLPLVKGSLAMLAPNLTEKDRVAIVVYAGAAGLVLPSTSGSDATTIVEALNRLEAGGSTNGAQGIELAYQVAQNHFVKGGVNRVILATDGDFNVGVTNQGDLTRLIEEKHETGISLSVLGFGMGNLKDSTMEKLAGKGNGNYFYIDSLGEARKVLVEQAGGTLVTVAKDVKLQVEFNPRTVAAYRLIGYENRLLQDQDFNNDTKDAGDMGAGHSVTALYELVPAGGKIDIPGIDQLKYQQPGAMSTNARLDETMTVKVRFKQPEASESTLTSVTIPTRTAMTPELVFASAVIEFGMLLRDSEFKGSSSFAAARQLASKFKGADAHGHRAEFIRLIDAAESVSRRK